MRPLSSWFRRSVKRAALVALGLAFMGIGVAGMMLPIVPGTIFFILGLSLFVRGLPVFSLIMRLPPVERRMRKKIGMRVKVGMIASIWLTYILTQLFVIWVRGVSLHELISRAFDDHLFVLALVAPVPVLVLISVYVMRLRNLLQIFGYTGD